MSHKESILGTDDVELDVTHEEDEAIKAALSTVFEDLGLIYGQDQFRHYTDDQLYDAVRALRERGRRLGRIPRITMANILEVIRNQSEILGAGDSLVTGAHRLIRALETEVLTDQTRSIIEMQLLKVAGLIEKGVKK